MTKITGLNAPPSKTPKDYLDNLEYSPYYTLALKICREKWNIINPDIGHVFLAMAEIAPLDNKLNPKGEKL